MTIAKGQPWGDRGVLAADGVVVHSDAQLAEVVTRARRVGDAVPMIGLGGGDLCATLGGTRSIEHMHGDQARRYPIDLGIACLDGVEHVFVAHAIARRRAWAGRFVVAMNAQWFHTWDLGPKSHPNDGLLDISDGKLPLSERLKARRRARTGTHLPHPLIEVRRTARWSTTLERATPVYLDGRRTGAASRLDLKIIPDALTVVI